MMHVSPLKLWVRSFLGRPRCVAGFFPGQMWVIICTRSSLKKGTPHTGVDQGKLNERTQYQQNILSYKEKETILVTVTDNSKSFQTFETRLLSELTKHSLGVRKIYQPDTVYKLGETEGMS